MGAQVREGGRAGGSREHHTDRAPYRETDREPATCWPTDLLVLLAWMGWGGGGAGPKRGEGRGRGGGQGAGSRQREARGGGRGQQQEAAAQPALLRGEGGGRGGKGEAGAVVGGGAGAGGGADGGGDGGAGGGARLAGCGAHLRRTGGQGQGGGPREGRQQRQAGRQGGMRGAEKRCRMWCVASSSGAHGPVVRRARERQPRTFQVGGSWWLGPPLLTPVAEEPCLTAPPVCLPHAASLPAAWVRVCSSRRSTCPTPCPAPSWARCGRG